MLQAPSTPRWCDYFKTPQNQPLARIFTQQEGEVNEPAGAGPSKRSVSGLTTIPDKIGASRAHWVDAASINFAGASTSNTAPMMKSGSVARSRSCARDFIAERLQRHDAAMRKARSCRENE